MSAARSMVETVKAHSHGGTDPASWYPGNPIRWACFGPECKAVSSSEMHQSLTDWYAEHLAGELEKAGFGDVRGDSAPDTDEDYDFGTPDPVFVRGRKLCTGTTECGSARHTHGCYSDLDAATCSEPGHHLAAPEARA